MGASVGELDAASFEGLSTFGQELVLLGRRFGDPAAEARIDGIWSSGSSRRRGT